MSEQTRSSTQGLSDRAAVAMLTLQLRTAQKELGDVRAEEASFDEPAARAELRARLEPLEAERRSALDDALVAARTEATTAVDAARRRATELVDEARGDAAPASTALRPDPVVVLPAAAAAGAPTVAPLIIDTTVADEPAIDEPVIVSPIAEPVIAEPVIAEPVIVEPVVAEPVIAEPVVVAAPIVTEPAPTPAADQPAAAAPGTAVSPVMPNVVLDAEAFARVFATVIAETIEKTRAESQQQQQFQGWPQAPGAPGAPYLGGMPPGMPYGQYPYYAPAPPQKKDGFWSHARHPDVILLGIATIIVLVIMVAWLS